MSKLNKKTASLSNPAKTVFQTDNPFPSDAWPSIDCKANEAILGLLCQLLEPLGHHRSTHVNPSKGKLSRKRKRKALDGISVVGETSKVESPAIASSLLIGYNAVVRCLQHMSRTPSSEGAPIAALKAIFVTGNAAWPPYAQLPIMCALAAQHSNTAIRLILLDKRSEKLIADTLKLPRIGIVGVLDNAPGADGLLGLVRESVEPIQLPWREELDHLLKGEWLGVKVEIVSELNHAAER